QSIVIESLKGGSKGSAVGAVTTIVTGVGVIATAPAWVPFIGGTMAISGSVLAVGAAVGGAAGVVTGAAKEYRKQKKINEEFKKAGF
ncbi:hypothetical protein, partial [Desulfobacter vibrioformis]|uniref:hypothetical protein n=1 Tax=Desulfobacter vibrioformis TaxID=34031 RepID=UPI00054D848F